jgi:steroid delta-isomerase-like uncharacterized protein
MSLEESKRLVRRQFDDLINRKDLSVIEADMAEDFVDHEAAPHLPPGREGARAWIRHLYEVVPDLHATIEDMVAEGDRVVVRNTWRGTHTGPFMGVPPTGRPFVLKGIVMWRVAGGKIVERWAKLDRFGLMQQLRSEG